MVPRTTCGWASNALRIGGANPKSAAHPLRRFPAEVKRIRNADGGTVSPAEIRRIYKHASPTDNFVPTTNRMVPPNVTKIDMSELNLAGQVIMTAIVREPITDSAVVSGNLSRSKAEKIVHGITTVR